MSSLSKSIAGLENDALPLSLGASISDWSSLKTLAEIDFKNFFKAAFPILYFALLAISNAALNSSNESDSTFEFLKKRRLRSFKESVIS